MPDVKNINVRQLHQPVSVECLLEIEVTQPNH